MGCPKTNKERQEEHRQAKKQQNLVRVEVWTRKDLVKKIRQYVKELNAL